MHAFVCSRLDFCNSVMFGVHSYVLDRLESILNAAARLILQIHKFSSISSGRYVMSCTGFLFDPGLFSSSASLSKAVSSILSRRALYPGLFGYWSSSKSALGFPRYPRGTKGQDRTIRSAGFLRFGPSPMELATAKNSPSLRKARSLQDRT